jgi:hypothetical protein
MKRDEIFIFWENKNVFKQDYNNEDRTHTHNLEATRRPPAQDKEQKEPTESRK